MHNKIRLFLFLVIFLLALSSGHINANVFKCPGENGEILYQQSTCKKGEEVDIKIHEPTPLEKHRAKVRADLNEIESIGITARLKRESEKRQASQSAAAERCQAAKDDILFWETQSRHNYTDVGRNYDLERVEQAKEKARQVCPSWEIE